MRIAQTPGMQVGAMAVPMQQLVLLAFGTGLAAGTYLLRTGATTDGQRSAAAGRAAEQVCFDLPPAKNRTVKAAMRTTTARLGRPAL
mmetsp:Transcript_72989/g.171099  ORF Transcript_72989/g.171099 Transcript_72989/m.171099 type:complete len:87 (-) Transcript_72989:347-607(-)